MRKSESTWYQLILNVFYQVRGKRWERPGEFLFQMVVLFERLLELTLQKIEFLLCVGRDISFDYAFDFTKASLGVFGFLGFANQ